MESYRKNVNGGFDWWPYGASITNWRHDALGPACWRNQNTTEAEIQVNLDLDVPSFEESGVVFRQSANMVVTKPAKKTHGGIQGLVHFGEGIFVRELFGKDMLLSFWIKSNVTGVRTGGMRSSFGKMRHRNDVDVGPWHTYQGLYSIDAPDVWEFKSIKIPRMPAYANWHFGNSLGFALYWFMGVGDLFRGPPGIWSENANAGGDGDHVWMLDKQGAYLKLCGVQLGEDTAESIPFQHQPEFDQFHIQRYFRSTFDESEVPHNYRKIEKVSGNQSQELQFQFSPPLRRTPDLADVTLYRHSDTSPATLEMEPLAADEHVIALSQNAMRISAATHEWRIDVSVPPLPEYERYAAEYSQFVKRPQ